MTLFHMCSGRNGHFLSPFPCSDMDISTQNRLSALPPVQNSLNSSHSSHSTIITSSSMSSSSSSSNGVQYRGSGQFISIAPTAIPSTHAVGLMHDPSTSSSTHVTKPNFNHHFQTYGSRLILIIMYGYS